MTSPKGTFSFQNDNVLQLSINDNLFIRIERIGFAVARLFFIDAVFAEIDIPAGLTVHDDTRWISSSTSFAY